jgi:N-acetylglutamate synthase-like GNAT family acetyltransferase/uncharacterized protein YjaG (DUF416 family)
MKGLKGVNIESHAGEYHKTENTIVSNQYGELDEKKQEIHKFIQRAIDKFKDGKGDLEAFESFVAEIELNNREIWHSQGFSWSQDQVEFVVKVFNDLTSDNSTEYSMDKIDKLQKILIHDMGVSDASQVSVSDLFAHTFVNMVRDENVNISRQFEKMVGYMGQDIQMFGPKEQYEMIHAMLDNPGKIDEDVRYNFIGGMILYGSFHEYTEYYESSTLAEKAKIIEVLGFLRTVGDDIYHGSSAVIHNLIEEMKKDEKNYLLDHYFQCINGKERYNWDIFRRYNDCAEKKIDPLYFEKIKYDFLREEMRQKTCFSAISDNYGVIYDYSGKINSFFISKDERTGEPRHISLKKMIEMEGVDIKDEEKLEVYLTTYKVLLEPIFRKKIEDDFHITLKDYSIRTQIQFLNFLSKSTVDNDDVKQLQSFLAKYQDNGLKSFLSLEHGGQEMGEKILKIGEKFDQETAEKIFAKYAQLADFAQDSAQYLSTQFCSNDQNKAQKITDHLLQRGKALLSLCADENMTAESVLKKLDAIKTEVEIFKESFRLVKSGDEEFSLENVHAIQLKIKDGPSVAKEKEMVEKMKEIYMQNYANFPQEFQQKIIASLETRLQNQQARFYVLQHGGKAVAFNSFLPQDDDTMHFANFNVDPNYTSSKLGEAMMEASLDSVAKEYAIVAEAVPGLPITKTYLEKKHFQKTGDIEIAGVKLWQIRREKDSQ